MSAANLANTFHARHARKPNVNQHYIGHRVSYIGKCFLYASIGSTALKPLASRNHLAQTFANFVPIFYQRYTNGGTLHKRAVS